MSRVTLHFDLNGPVTPELFAQRVAQACDRFGAMRPGEKVITEHGHLHVRISGDEAPPWPNWLDKVQKIA